VATKMHCNISLSYVKRQPSVLLLALSSAVTSSPFGSMCVDCLVVLLVIGGSTPVI
jgi:hypothetical protein